MVEQALAVEGVEYNQSIFTPFLTLYTFLSQVFDPDHSGRAAVARVIVYWRSTVASPARSRPAPTAMRG